MKNTKEIFKFLERKFGVTKIDILSKSREGNLIQVKKLAIYLVRTKLKYSYPRIGMIFKRKHSTIIHHFKNFKIPKDIDTSNIYYSDHI